MDAPKRVVFQHTLRTEGTVFLVSRSMRFPAETNHIAKQTASIPHLFIQKPQTVSEVGRRRVYLELSLRSIEEIWVTVITVTSPLSRWPLADNALLAPETVDDGPTSYIFRLSGVDNENWRFWLEASSSEELRVDVAVLDQQVSEEVKAVKRLFPAIKKKMSTFTT